MGRDAKWGTDFDTFCINTSSCNFKLNFNQHQQQEEGPSRGTGSSAEPECPMARVLDDGKEGEILLIIVT